MKIKRKRKNRFIETCAASDLAFLLIIYFLVISGFNTNMGFLMNLPAQNSTRLILAEDLLRFEINEHGQILHGVEIISIQEARAAISNALVVNPYIAVILTIDGDAYWQNVVNFVEVAQSLNVDAFSFSKRREAK